MHPGAAFFRDEVLPNLPNVLDFRRFSYESLFAESDRVVALVNFGLTGNDAMIKISEHWTVKDGKAASIWVAYFEPLSSAGTTSSRLPSGHRPRLRRGSFGKQGDDNHA